ncbi:MAG: DUF1190 domain-containing protein [Bosea sp. (in: a-proteobacteria)]
MKRSEYIAIGAVGMLAVAAFWPRNVTSVGGGSEETVTTDAQAFATVEECRTTAGMTAEACERAFAAAQQAAVADAPRFDNQNSCEAQYGSGQCRSSTWNGASVFVPALVGMLVARSMANAAQPQGQPLYPPRAGPANCPQGANTPGQPECAPQSRSSTSSSGAAVGRTYSTGSGRTVTRPPGSDARVRVDARPRGGTSATTSSGTVARSGFGSTGRAGSSGS